MRVNKDENIEKKSDIRKILKEIYSNVYCKFEEQDIVVFYAVVQVIRMVNP